MISDGIPGTQMSPASTDDEPAEVDLSRLLAEEYEADEQIAGQVAADVERAHQADRRHAMALAMLREAAGLTQAEVARHFGTSQARISQVEAGSDMYLSTFVRYLAAIGWRSTRFVATTADGEEVEVDLEELISVPPAA